MDYEGRIIADRGRNEGFLAGDIPLGELRPRVRSFEGEPSSPQSYLFEDRRTDVYQPITNI